MFSISLKSKIGIIALLDLADHYGIGLVQIKDIVERRNVPQNYLEQIFNLLTKTGMINGIRGKNGGYELNRHPTEITVLNVLEAIEGEVQLNYSKEVTAIQFFFKEVKIKIENALKVTLFDLVQKQKAIERLIDFQI